MTINKTNIMHKRPAGFTIVELLIVIVVVGILAAISIVAYNGIQDRARDSQIKQGVNEVEKAIRRYHIEAGRQPYMGSSSTGSVSGGVCPGATSAGGWAGSGLYTCTLEEILVDSNLLPVNYITNLPKNPSQTPQNGKRTIMFYACGSNRYGLYWALNQPTSAETASAETVRSTCGHSTLLNTTYGMSAARLVELR